MAALIFPAWWYGPRGDAEVFQCLADVPKGWRETPFAEVIPPTTDERLSETSGDLAEAKACIARLEKQLAEAVETARERIGLETEVDRLQVANADLSRQLAEAEAVNDALAAKVADADKSGDGTIDDAKSELVKALRAAGVDFDARWGLARLQALLADVEADQAP